MISNLGTDLSLTPIHRALGEFGKTVNLAEVLQHRTAELGEQIAFTFLNEDGTEQSLTYQELDRSARSIAWRLSGQLRQGDRALLLFPPGLDFVAAFFGCLYAGVLAVPVTYPKAGKRMRRLTAIAHDCDPAVVLTTSATLANMDLACSAPELVSLPVIATDTGPEDAWCEFRPPVRDGSDVAFLQYTSGSTSDPKGVMVTHRNLLHNLEMIRRGFNFSSAEPPCGVFWLPAYHDMGLIGGILEPVYVGGRSILMSPTRFLRRPFTWLQAIAKYRATVSGAPNFAYDLCIRKLTTEQRSSLDLSSWRLAFCGAEPVRAETLQRFANVFASTGFRADSFYPCYGLAEATLLASGGEGPSLPVIRRVDAAALGQNCIVQSPADVESGLSFVGCGSALLGQKVIIVDPVSREPLPSNRVGEIWIHGQSVARGYWGRPEQTSQTFGARLSDDPSGAAYLRTGDLGFILDEQLFVTGRLKDVIVIRGRNQYPQDIELTVRESHPSLRDGGGAAFAVDIDGEESLVIVHEVERRADPNALGSVLRTIRRALVEEHELDARAIVLIRAASLPRTTSGKVQRQLCKQKYLNGELSVVAQWTRAASPAESDEAAASTATTQSLAAADAPAGSHLTAIEVDRQAERIEAWLLEWLQKRAAVPAEELDRDRPFAEFGLDSMTAVELSQELEDWLKVELNPVIAWSYPTPAAMARYLAGQVSGLGQEPIIQALADDQPQPSEFEKLLADVEALSDEDIEALKRETGPE